MSTCDAMMRQTRLDRYFDISHPPISPGLTFLQLPADIRALVYSHLSLDEGDHIHLNSPVSGETEELSGKAHFRTSPVHTLLLVCRILYQEICPLLYAQNRFAVSYNAPGGLDPIFNLSPLAIASMVSLTIALHECHSACESMDQDRFCWFDCEDCVALDSPKKRKSLASKSRQDIAVVKKWDQLCWHLARFTEPSQLHLCVICDTHDLHTAQAIVEPMHQLPRLAAFSIRLSADPVPELQSLARSTALRLTGQPSVAITKVTLPNELQAEILGHTDLVAPHALKWIPKIGYECRSPNLDISRRWQSGPSIRNPCELCLRVHRKCSIEMGRPTTTYSQCTCWRFPAALFLVSHEIHRIATRIFYSSNRFQNGSWDYDARYWQPGLDFLPLNKRLQQRTVSQLRSLQFVIPDVLDFSPETFDKSMKDWVRCLDILYHNAHLAQLAIMIDMSSGRDNDGYCTTEGIQRDRAAWERERRIVKPVRLLRGLKDLFIHLGYPNYSRDYVEERCLRERALERSIMGRSYDACDRGKRAISNPY